MITLDPVVYSEIQQTAFNSLRNVLSSQFDVLIDNAAGRVDSDVLINVFTAILNATHEAEEQIFNVLSMEVSKQIICDILTRTTPHNSGKNINTIGR